MSVTLTVFFRTNLTTLTELHSSVEDAADVVASIADCLGAEMFAADLSTFGHQGHLFRGVNPDDIVATYEIEEH
jgi:hypothetical protein